MGRKERDDARETGLYRYPPWWRRIYFDKQTVLIAVGLGVLASIKIWLTGTFID